MLGYSRVKLRKDSLMSDSRLAPVTGGSTIDHSRAVTKMIVDPHESDSFVIDLNTIKPTANPYKVKDDNSQDLRKLAQAERSKMISDNLRRFSTTASATTPPSLGTVASTIDGANHVHPAAQLPEASVTPPMVRVYFDMPSLATLNYKYHGATITPGYLVLTTDMRYAGPGEFYPFTSKLANEADAYIGVMVEGIDSLFIVKPPILQHKFGPYEHCLVPISQEKSMPAELIQELVEDKPVETSPQKEYDDRASKRDVDPAKVIEEGVL